jgi:hypothetical protein
MLALVFGTPTAEAYMQDPSSFLGRRFVDIRCRLQIHQEISWIALS